jgi:hypothetical protein
MAIARWAALVIGEALGPPFMGCRCLATHVKESFMHDVLSNGPHPGFSRPNPCILTGNSKYDKYRYASPAH